MNDPKLTIEDFKVNQIYENYYGIRFMVIGRDLQESTISCKWLYADPYNLHELKYNLGVPNMYDWKLILDVKNPEETTSPPDNLLKNDSKYELTGEFRNPKKGDLYVTENIYAKPYAPIKRASSDNDSNPNMAGGKRWICRLKDTTYPSYKEIAEYFQNNPRELLVDNLLLTTTSLLLEPIEGNWYVDFAGDPSERRFKPYIHTKETKDTSEYSCHYKVAPEGSKRYLLNICAYPHYPDKDFMKKYPGYKLKEKCRVPEKGEYYVVLLNAFGEPACVTKAEHEDASNRNMFEGKRWICEPTTKDKPTTETTPSNLKHPPQIIVDFMKYQPDYKLTGENRAPDKGDCFVGLLNRHGVPHKILIAKHKNDFNYSFCGGKRWICELKETPEDTTYPPKPTERFMSNFEDIELTGECRFPKEDEYFVAINYPIHTPMTILQSGPKPCGKDKFGGNRWICRKKEAEKLTAGVSFRYCGVFYKIIEVIDTGYYYQDLYESRELIYFKEKKLMDDIYRFSKGGN